jgi:hypothetical protein
VWGEVFFRVWLLAIGSALKMVDRARAAHGVARRFSARSDRLVSDRDRSSASLDRLVSG